MRKFKKLKLKAVEYLSSFPIEIFNRFDKNELREALGKDSLSEEDLPRLLKWAYDNFHQIKLNLRYHTFDIQLLREKVKGVGFRNNIISRCKATGKKSNRHLVDYRILVTQELEIITEIHNTLCSIFECDDSDNTDYIPLISEVPDFGFTDTLLEYFEFNFSNQSEP